MANSRRNSHIEEAIAQYWDGRAASYSNNVRSELGDDRGDAWRRVLDRASCSHIAVAHAESRPARILDLGCGPGFFSILFAEMGCKVDAIDASDEMLTRARMNAEAMGFDDAITFFQGDVAVLPFEEGTFDIVASRNLMWLMHEPETAYAEWMRVLRPGGKLVLFDANWYLYLFDEEIDARRRADQEGKQVAEWAEDARATPEEERRCERLALELPLSPVIRPAWDVEVLTVLGATSIHADLNAWTELWTESEYSFFATSPLFMVEALKADGHPEDRDLNPNSRS